MSVFRTDALHMGKTRQDAIPHAHELAIWRLKKAVGILLESVDVLADCQNLLACACRAVANAPEYRQADLDVSSP